MKKVAFYTLGCKLNFSETSTISRQFEERGFQKVNFNDSPEIFIINTCSVTDNADKKCRKIVRDARKISPHAYIAIIGCYAQLKPKEISTIPGVDAVLGAAEKFRLLDVLDDFVKTKQTRVLASSIGSVDQYHHAYSLNDRTRTFLKVQDGCNYTCTFCTIPLARGKSRSDDIHKIVASTQKIAQAGVKEIVLTGVNIGDFGWQNGKKSASFFELIQALDQVQGIERFRISSIEPNLLNDEIIDFVAASNRFAPHFHMPLQSGSNKILKLMRRRYLRELYTERVMHIRKQIPAACIGVDVIVGFPGETEEDFISTYNYLKELDVNYLHVFTYSERDNTQALQLPGVVSKKIRRERSIKLRQLSDKLKRLFYEKNMGKNACVLFENDIENGRIHGFTGNYIRVVGNYFPERVNQLEEVTLTKINENGLMEVNSTAVHA